MTDGEQSGQTSAGAPLDFPVDGLYADVFEVNANQFGVVLSFLMSAPDRPHTPLVRVRMSPQHAKLMTMIMSRSLHNYEENLGIEIPLPTKAWTEHDLDPEKDW